MCVRCVWKREEKRERPERERTRYPMTIDKVGLSAVQKVTVDSLYFFYGQRLSGLNKDFQPRFRAVMGDFRAELRQILSEDQRVTYDSLVLEREADRTLRRRNNREPRRPDQDPRSLHFPTECCERSWRIVFFETAGR